MAYCTYDSEGGICSHKTLEYGDNEYEVKVGLLNVSMLTVMQESSAWSEQQQQHNDSAASVLSDILGASGCVSLCADWHLLSTTICAAQQYVLL
jgi:hypothetical protein